MPIYIIKDDQNNEINRIDASLDFVQEHFTNYELYVDSEREARIRKEAEREWRNSELERTDIFATVSDYPHATELTAYRTALRDWPASSDFPDTRPESLEDRIANA